LLLKLLFFGMDQIDNRAEIANASIDDAQRAVPQSADVAGFAPSFKAPIF